MFAQLRPFLILSMLSVSGRGDGMGGHEGVGGVEREEREGGGPQGPKRA